MPRIYAVTGRLSAMRLSALQMVELRHSLRRMGSAMEAERLAARMICVGFDGLSMPASARELIERGVSSVILFSRNYESPKQLAELCGEIKASGSPARPIMICIDQEGGRVQRLREPFTIVPSMREIGQMNDVSLARNVGQILGRELRAVNIDMNLAPVLDVDSNPANPVIGARSFGNDPQLVARLGCAMADGLQSAGIAACGKHFPGHGDTALDSHFHLPRITHSLERLNQIELPPFRAAIAVGVASIMAAHIIIEQLDAQHPASMSDVIINNLLRTKLGFTGVVISDDLEMKAIIDHFGIVAAVTQGVLAGVDLFCICHTVELQHDAIEALVHAVEDGRVTINQLREANTRLDALFSRYVRP